MSEPPQGPSPDDVPGLEALLRQSQGIDSAAEETISALAAVHARWRRAWRETGEFTDEEAFGLVRVLVAATSAGLRLGLSWQRSGTEIPAPGHGLTRGLPVRFLLRFLIVLAVCGLAVSIGLHPGDWQNWLGFSKAAYFTNGQNYAFYSGVGPMMLTGIGLSTIIAGLWHHVNCHQDGCLRIGRHKIEGTPWCNAHHSTARKHLADLDDVVDRLDRLLTLIEADAGQVAEHTSTLLAGRIAAMPETGPPEPAGRPS